MSWRSYLLSVDTTSTICSNSSGFSRILVGKYVPDLSDVIVYNQINLRPDLSYEEQPVWIRDQCDLHICNKVIGLVRVQ